MVALVGQFHASRMKILQKNMVQNIILFLSIKHKPSLSDNPFNNISRNCVKYMLQIISAAGGGDC